MTHGRSSVGPGPPATFALAVVLLLALAAALPGPRTLRDAWRLVGILPLAGGVALHGWAWRLFRRRGTSVRAGEIPGELVTGGPYRWSRNPMYLAGILVLAGLALAVGRTTPLLIPFLYAWIVRIRFLPAEERVLERRFGERYLRYRERVRAWV